MPADVIDQELVALGAVLVEERVLRRVIKQHRRVRGIGLQVPHDHCYSLPRSALAELTESDELALPLDDLPATVIVVHGDRTALAAGDETEHTALWRKLFHARVHQAFDALGAQHVAAVRQRIHAIGQTEFDEIRSVLKQEDLLLPPVDAWSTYVEFAALYAELRAFAPEALGRTFPAMFDLAHVDRAIARDVDTQALLSATRPPRAPLQPVLPSPAEDKAKAAAERVVAPRARGGALAAQKKGNHARAAILFARAGDDLNARSELEALGGNLARTLGDVAPDRAAAWAKALLPVAVFAAQQLTSRFDTGARLLHDLQAASMVTANDVKAVDVVGWMLARGKQKVVRPLPATREVRIAKHAHAAVAKIAACALPTPDEREQLSATIHEIARAADDQLRGTVRPKIEAALAEVGLHPHSLPERVGMKKLVDELLDRAVEIGRLTLGDLRDALSRNDLKLPDLQLSDLRRGDELLRVDTMLSHSLDGVYRRGESYMRALQKLSSVLFGTPVGRFLTLYLMLPLLGAFSVVEGLQHMIGPVWHKLTGVTPHIASNTSLLVGAGYLFLLIHVGFVRRGSILFVRGLWRGLKFVIVDLPLWLVRLRGVQWLLASRGMRWVVKPAIPAVIVWLATWQVIDEVRYAVVGGVLLLAAFALNSRAGRRAEEWTLDLLVRSSRQVTSRLVPGLVRYTLELFARLVESLDRFIYRVDEWLRFRTGQSTLKLVFKGVFGTVWFVITYIVRLYVNLFVEPTTNPIKHFPIVTVAAKIMIPFIPAILEGITGPASVLLGTQLGRGFAAFTVLVLPGLAGFLVWELKENWNLYRRTRPATLRPLAIGHHGESMARFLRPGFHSGTIPKLFTKLRRAAWRDDAAAATRATEGLHHVESAVVRFVDRQLVSMLNESVAFRAVDVASRHVDIGSNRIQIELQCPSVSPELAMIRFELQSGWLVASLPTPGWIAKLTAEQRAILEIALAGFYKLSAVDIVREQLEQALVERKGDAAPPYDVADDGIVVWPGDGFESEVVYDLHADRLTPRTRGTPYAGHIVDLAGHHALFGREPLYWALWAATWQRIARGEAPERVIAGPTLTV